MAVDIAAPTRARRREAAAGARRPTLAPGSAAQLHPGGSRQNAAAAAALLGAELEELTQTELIAFVPQPQAFDRMVPPELFGRLLRRGLDVRVLHGHTRSGEPVPFPTLSRVGIAAPTTFALPYPVIVRDRSVLYMPHPDPRHPYAHRLAPQPHVIAARSLALAFDLAWSAAAAQAASPPPLGRISAEQREILQVLSSGLTDDHAAALLHISRRTFARRVAALMDTLGVTSRFQVGAEAVRHGLI